jgi:Zn-dependent peptidase ImmA (M78 family)
MLVPFRTFEEIEKEALRFLTQYNPNKTIPVPIEEIVEFDIAVNIFPTHRLRERINVEGFITSDLKMLYVDENVMKRYPNRYRFTLAHEIAHWYLHKDYISSTTVNNPDEWKTINFNRPPEEHRKLEFQANEFAGRILVPSLALSRSVTNVNIKLGE